MHAKGMDKAHLLTAYMLCGMLMKTILWIIMANKVLCKLAGSVPNPCLYRILTFARRLLSFPRCCACAAWA